MFAPLWHWPAVIAALVSSLAAAYHAKVPASRTIEPGRSIGSIGPHGADARRVIGAPDDGDATRAYYRRAGLRVIGFGKFEVATEEPRYRTTKGIGVGSSIGAIRRAYPTANCSRVVCGLNIGDGATLLEFDRHLHVRRVVIQSFEGPED